MGANGPTAARVPAPVGLGLILAAYIASQVAAVLASAAVHALAPRLQVALDYVCSSACLGAAGIWALRWAPRARRPPVEWPGWLWAVAAAAAGLTLKVFADLLAAAERGLTGPIHGNNPLVLFPDAFGRAAALPLLILSVVVLAPAAEELLFRGLLYGWLRARLPTALAALLAALAFGAAHGNVTLLLPLTLVGAGLCLLYEWSGSLWPPAIAHAALNAASLGLALLATRS